MLTIGDRFPEFRMKGVVSNELSKAFQDFTQETDAGKWKVFYFYPKDFTFVCPTEIIGFDQSRDKFQDLNSVLYGVSTDSEFVHHAWRSSHPQLKEIHTPLLSDIKKDLSSQLGILDASEGVCFRATFIVDPEGIIRHVSVNDLPVGRSPEETLRILAALQTKELTPCNWKQGEDVLKAS